MKLVTQFEKGSKDWIKSISIKWAWNLGGKRESPVLVAGACSE